MVVHREAEQRCVRCVSSDGLVVPLLQSVLRRAYDHHAGIYLLLDERLRHHRSSYPCPAGCGLARRRPSSVAEQAARLTAGPNSAEPTPAAASGAGGAPSFDEGVEVDMADELLPPSAPTAGAGGRHPPVARKPSDGALAPDSPFGSVTSTESNNFESFDSQMEPDMFSSSSSCYQPPALAKPPCRPTLACRHSVRHNPLETAAGGRRSPVSFREGRRASDGLVASQVRRRTPALGEPPAVHRTGRATHCATLLAIDSNLLGLIGA